MKSKKTFITLTALFFLLGLSLVGLGREGLRLLPSVEAQELTPAEPQTDRGQGPQAISESNRQGFPGVHNLKGKYLDSATATVLPDGLAPAACVGIVTFDGRGNLRSTETHSFNGLIIPEAHYVGDYTLNDDYSGIMTIRSLEQGFTFKQKFVLNPLTNEITYIVIENGEVSTGTMKKMQ